MRKRPAPEGTGQVYGAHVRDETMSEAFARFEAARDDLKAAVIEAVRRDWPQLVLIYLAVVFIVAAFTLT